MYSPTWPSTLWEKTSWRLQNLAAWLWLSSMSLARCSYLEHPAKGKESQRHEGLKETYHLSKVQGTKSTPTQIQNEFIDLQFGHVWASVICYECIRLFPWRAFRPTSTTPVYGYSLWLYETTDQTRILQMVVSGKCYLKKGPASKLPRRFREIIRAKPWFFKERKEGKQTNGR